MIGPLLPPQLKSEYRKLDLLLENAVRQGPSPISDIPSNEIANVTGDT